MSTSPNTLQHLIIHQLHKEPNGPARVALSSAEMPINSAAQRLVDHLCQLYGSRNGKGFGKFEEDEHEYPMPALVRRYVDDTDFLGFSQQAIAQLQVRAEQEAEASGGYVLMAHVSNSEMDFLFFALVGEVIGTAVNADLHLEDSIHLDMDHLRVAGRIDLGVWQAGGERYVSFLRGRGDVAAYFKLFLGCNDMVTPLKETQKLVKGLEQFVEQQALSAQDRDEVFQRAHNLLDEMGNEQGEVNLAEVASQIYPDAPQALQAALQHEDLGLIDGFVPDRRAIKPLMRFKAAAPEWKLEFDRASLRSGAVIYDKHSDTLVLSNIPDKLKKALLEQ
ncbi:nucleoid-associated protein [uncultured Deefgea sp.]|uniref:nucleoid-associated protein n=1 Tax=uncultured Deefgea sp. TaxID=1304914 RepID=UPI002592E617|nr:nucleoid-associated protein [uncultured Deefgea sp.]